MKKDVWCGDRALKMWKRISQFWDRCVIVNRVVLSVKRSTLVISRSAKTGKMDPGQSKSSSLKDWLSSKTRPIHLSRASWMSWILSHQRHARNLQPWSVQVLMDNRWQLALSRTFYQMVPNFLLKSKNENAERLRYANAFIRFIEVVKNL